MLLSRIQVKMSLKLGDKVHDRDVVFPLFPVVKPEGGVIQIDSEYCPPLLTLAAGNFLAGTEELPGPKTIHIRVQELTQKIRNKVMQLAGISSNDESFGRNISSKHHLWIRSLVQGVMNLEVVANSPESTPR